MGTRAILAMLVAPVAVVGLTSCSTGSVPPPATTTVPAAAAHGYPADEIGLLCAAGLRPVFVDAPLIRGADGNVNGYAASSVSPLPGSTVVTGSTVEIRVVVSHNAGGPFPLGPPSSPVPNVVGLDVNEAIATMAARGLLVDVTTATPTGTMTVTAQSPQAGATARRGSTVALMTGAVGSDGCGAP